MTNPSTIASINSLLMKDKEEMKTVSIMNESEIDIKHDDVSIIPSHIEFTEAIEGLTYRQRITIKNIGNKPAFIRIHQPNSIVFQIKILKNSMRVYPGLSMTTCVIYTFKRPSLLRAIIPIEINGKIFDYRVICRVATEGISVEPKSIDFGIIDVGYSSGVKIITIRNEGGKGTRQSDLGVIIKPLRGIVKPRTEVKLQVELIGMHEGDFYTEFWIKSVPNIRVPIKVKVIVPRLVVYHPNATGDFVLIDFPPTIENTSRYETFVLRNLSSRVSTYVVLGELVNEVKCIRDIDRKQYPVYSAFEIRPYEGRLDPFQGIIFEVRFSPTIKLSQWRDEEQRTKIGNKHESRENRDFIAFIRIVRIHCIESRDTIKEATIGTSSLSISCISNTDSAANNVVKLYLYGEVETAQLYIEPDILYFGDLLVGQISRRVLRLTNSSAVTPIYLACVPNAAARCRPKWMRLKSRASIEVLVEVRGKESVESSFKLFFNVMVDSCDSIASRMQRLGKIKIKSYSVECTVDVILRSKEGFLSKRCLPTPLKTTTDCDDEIIKRILRPPKWKDIDYSRTFDRFISCAVEKSISATKAAVLIPLSPLQIYKVHIHPTTFAFGMVAPNSFNYRPLVVRNVNDIPVMVQLLTSLSSKCIHFPEGNLMILQPGSTMTKLVEYHAIDIGKFYGYINYVINDNHFFDLRVIAEIVHKQLYIEEKEFELGKEWLSEETYRPIASVVRIKNKLDAKTYFRWEIPAVSGFHIQPTSGYIRGNTTLHAYAYYESDNTKTDSTQATMRCENRYCASLRLNAPRCVPKVEFVNDNTNLGEIPLNLSTKVIAVLQNFGFDKVTYEVDRASLTGGCDVYPLQGKISPRGIAILEVYLTFDVCCSFSIVIAVIIQKGPRLLYKINGRVSLPRLKILPQRIDLARISANSFQTRRITVTNIGTTILKLQFLLEDYPEFCISLSANSKNSDIGMEGITIVPGACQSLYLHFQPNDLAIYSFYLPMVVNQLLGPASMSDPKSVKPSELLRSREIYYANLPGFAITPLPAVADKLPTVTIDCIVIARTVFLNKLLFRFNATTNELSEELCIENRSTPWEMLVSINIVEFGKIDCPFTIEWSRGAEVRRTSDSIECALSTGSSVSFVLGFEPRIRGVFSVEAPIRVRGGIDSGGVLNKLHLDGEFPASSIDVEPTEIYFAPVPLGTAIEEEFKIRAGHFDYATSIRSNFSTASRCEGDHRGELLHVEFLNGSAVPLRTYVELKARVTFKSDHPVSFCSTIEFRDDRALAVCHLMVYATADDSLLTTYIYPMRSFIFDDARINVPHPSVSSDDGTDDSDDHAGNSQKISHVFRRRELSESRFDVTSPFVNRSKSILGKIMDSRMQLPGNGEINANNAATDDKDAQADERRMTVEKRISIRERRSTFSIDSETRRRRTRLERSLCYLADDGNDDYEKYMRRITTIMEEWMYTGPLKFRFYPNIPLGIAAAFSNYCVRRRATASKGKGSTAVPSFIDVLESLVGTKILHYLGELQPLPEDDTDRIDYVLQLYDKTLDFLLSHGAHLIHVSARFLLSYDDYLISIDIAQRNARRNEFHDTNMNRAQRLSRQSFESRSRQCWLDVVLQTYRCFVLAGIHERKLQTLPSFTVGSSRRSTVYRESIVSSTSSSSKQYELHESAIRSIADLPSDKLATGNRCFEERFLLAWLQYHYEQQCAQDWMTDRRVILNPRERQDVAEPRPVHNFLSDLSDGLVLIAVTAAYCPFLVDEYFSNLYICPRCKEEELHNVICLVSAWRKIRLGFIITPMQLIKPNQLQMLLLTVHLFQALPTYVPHAKIKFCCPLSQTITRHINVSNPTDNTVNYLLSFANNANNSFTILKPTSILRLNARDSGQVQVQFHAKKIRKSRAHLLLCGRAVGPHFGRNQTIVLEGHVDSLEIANEYTIRSKLYEIVETSLIINVPYRNAAEYDIWMTEERPSHPSTLKMAPWCELCTRRIPRRLFLNQNSLIVAEGSTNAHLSFSVACFVPQQRIFWLIFQAKTGDFIIQINSACQTSINDRIVVEWRIQGECICSHQRGGIIDACPFNINIPIPSRNSQFWKCITEMFQKTLDSKERLFWSKYVDTRIGLYLIRWLMEDSTDSATSEFIHVFDNAVTYKVTISNKKSLLIVPEYFTIQDVRSTNEQIPMIVHISSTTPLVYETTMTLTSLSGKELRVYIINCLHL